MGSEKCRYANKVFLQNEKKKPFEFLISIVPNYPKDLHIYLYLISFSQPYNFRLYTKTIPKDCVYAKHILSRNKKDW